MFNLFKSIFKNNNEELKEALKNKAFLVDVRSYEEFLQGNVNGSVNIPLNVLPNHLNKFKGKKHIVVFCRSGMRSAQAKSILERNGFVNVINGKTWGNVKNTIQNLKP